jgi:hypothetical protein
MGFESNRPLTGGEPCHLIEQCDLLDRTYPTAPTSQQVWTLRQAGRWRVGMTKRQAQREIVRLVMSNR